MTSTLAPKLGSASAHQGKADVRDDEEQQIKLQQCLELLVAVGYFRARIQGLPPFDKLVGGMAWCIETCSIDLDVDLLYHDSLSIGQKIALTERLVSVLPDMQCPHSLQPHQVQGLDAIHILPVMQWLVKEALSKRAQFGSVSRAVAALHCPTSRREIVATDDTVKRPYSDPKLLQMLSTLQCRYRYRRRWCVGVASSLPPQQRVHATLLEYDPSPAEGEGRGTTPTIFDSTSDIAPNEESLELSRLMRSLIEAPQMVVSGTEGYIGQHSLLSVAAEAAAVMSPKHRPILPVSSAALSEQLSGLQSEVLAVEQETTRQVAECTQLQQQVTAAHQQLQQVQQTHLQLKDETEAKGAAELKALVEAAEKVKKAEHLYKEQCRAHVQHLNEQISELEERLSSTEDASSDDNQLAEIRAMVEQERERCGTARLLAADASRTLARLTRAWDDVPGRAELTQYSIRLTELNDLAMSSSRETQQFETMLETLTRSKSAMDTHFCLLNDTLESMRPCIKTPESTVQLLQEVQASLQQLQLTHKQVSGEQRSADNRHTEVSGRLAQLHDTEVLYTRMAAALAATLAKSSQLQAPGVV